MDVFAYACLGCNSIFHCGQVHYYLKRYDNYLIHQLNLCHTVVTVELLNIMAYDHRPVSLGVLHLQGVFHASYYSMVLRNIDNTFKSRGALIDLFGAQWTHRTTQSECPESNHIVVEH